MDKKINEIATIITEKINSLSLSTNNYVSTENMLPNFNGITQASSIPSGNVSHFRISDILISNIRPYFRKIWFSNRDGGCSNDVIILRANEGKVLPKYLYYALTNDYFINYYVASCKGTKMPRGNKDALLEWVLDVPSREIQQHIVNTIGSVDDLIENYQSQILSLFNYGLLLINQLNESNELVNLSTIAKLEKGNEVGSSVYLDHKTNESIKYLRVGDLLSEGSTYIPQDESKNEALEDDILIAFDGAPGRNAIGLSGSFSSGIYKIGCDNKNKGLVYFELNSKINQKIISDHSQGTTILHASKAIPHLVSVSVNNKELHKLNSIFNRLVYLKKTVRKLRSNKELLLDKYFTNQQ